jgi:hypothetical protein
VIWLVACHAPAPDRLWLGGDVFVAERASGRLALGLTGDGVVNLEGPVGPVGSAEVSGEVRLVNAEAALPDLRAQGVVAVGVENNHRDDLGEAGPPETRAAAERHGLRVVDRAGLEHGAFALTAHLVGDGGPPAGFDAELAAAARRGDLVALLHTSGDGPGLADAVDRAVAAGARVVAVHGSHEIGPVERRGRAVVAWGLGNLLFDCACTDGAEGLILEVERFADGAIGASIVPVRAGLHGAPAARASDPDEVFDRLEALGSSPLVRGDGVAVL